MSEFITVKEAPEKAPVLYKWVAKEPGGVVPGVAARDLTAYDLAAYSPSQRMKIDAESKREGGAYKKVGTVPRALSFEPEEVVAPQPDAEPAATTGKKGR
jgi:hypothetical protein